MSILKNSVLSAKYPSAMVAAMKPRSRLTKTRYCVSDWDPSAIFRKLAYSLAEDRLDPSAMFVGTERAARRKAESLRSWKRPRQAINV